jgi:hypothetical protein
VADSAAAKGTAVSEGKAAEEARAEAIPAAVETGVGAVGGSTACPLAATERVAEVGVGVEAATGAVAQTEASLGMEAAAAVTMAVATGARATGVAVAMVAAETAL